jgi:hypothetical protein
MELEREVQVQVMELEREVQVQVMEEETVEAQAVEGVVVVVEVDDDICTPVALNRTM